jgi:penicillin amidase
VALLYPDREPVSDPIVDNPNGWKFKPVQPQNAELALPQDFIKVTQLPTQDPTIGSNNWAANGSKTATGSPILCNDPHLDLNLPSIWYLIQLHAPAVNTMGASLPGSPGVIIGFNDSIAWGMTNAQRDLVDWYKITFKDENRNFYLLDSSWVASEKVVEKISVRGGEIFYDTVIHTRWGPVTYDESFRKQSNLKNYAFRWIAHDESEELTAFHKLNRARNHADYMEALNHFDSPAQNFVFASAANDIAMRIQGKYPVRRPLEGKFVLDGSQMSSG